jgi:hypothetical protein
MREIDLKSLLIAGALGSVFVAVALYDQPEISLCSALLIGFLVGSGVQFGERLLGAS